jgi:hypothetical protein
VAAHTHVGVWTCTVCPANTYAVANATGSVCVACPTGSNSTAGATTCACRNGFASAGAGVSLVCSGASQASLSERVRVGYSYAACYALLACAPGTYSQAGADCAGTFGVAIEVSRDCVSRSVPACFFQHACRARTAWRRRVRVAHAPPTAAAALVRPRARALLALHRPAAVLASLALVRLLHALRSESEVITH